MKTAIVALLLLVGFPAASRTETFAGTVSDDMCSRADHSQMRMGSSDAECTTACIDAHGASYVLYDGKNVFLLSSRQTLAPFAGQRVKVVGELDTKTRTVRVDAIALVK